MIFRSTTAVSLVLLFSACSPTDETPAQPDPVADLVATANTLARETIIVDTHVDVPDRLAVKFEMDGVHRDLNPLLHGGGGGSALRLAGRFPSRKNSSR